MKIAEMRSVMDRFAAFYEAAGRKHDAAALRQLSGALSAANKHSVSNAIQKLREANAVGLPCVGRGV